MSRPFSNYGVRKISYTNNNPGGSSGDPITDSDVEWVKTASDEDIRRSLDRALVRITERRILRRNKRRRRARPGKPHPVIPDALYPEAPDPPTLEELIAKYAGRCVVCGERPLTLVNRACPGCSNYSREEC